MTPFNFTSSFPFDDKIFNFVNFYLCLLLLIIYVFFAVLRPKVTHVRQHAFIRGRFLGIGKRSIFKGWLVSFFLFSLHLWAIRNNTINVYSHQFWYYQILRSEDVFHREFTTGIKLIPFLPFTLVLNRLALFL